MSKTAPKTVLVADDDASMRTVLSHALKREGYNVEATDNGATLFRWVAEGRGMGGHRMMVETLRSIF